MYFTKKEFFKRKHTNFLLTSDIRGLRVEMNESETESTISVSTMLLLICSHIIQ